MKNGRMEYVIPFLSDVLYNIYDRATILMSCNQQVDSEEGAQCDKEGERRPWGVWTEQQQAGASTHHPTKASKT